MSSSTISDTCDKACKILEATNDGDDLDPNHLKLVELAVNGFLNESGEEAFDDLCRQVEQGYQKPWFHDIENLTIDQVGYVYWKGKIVEHYDSPYCWSEDAKVSAQEVARRCRILEYAGKEVNTTTVIWRWNKDA